MANKPRHLYTFASFRLDTAERVLTRDGSAVTLASKTFDLLVLLVESGGRLVDKRELMLALWPDTSVEEANLSFQISTLRKALGADGHTLIETVPKHGYRFAAAVQHADTVIAPEPTFPEPVSRARRPGVALLAAAVAVATLLAGAGYLLFRAPASVALGSSALRPIQLTAYPDSEGTPSLSPEGSQVAFAWNGGGAKNYDIYLKVAGEGEPIRLTTDAADEVSPAWSPDGKQIAFIRLFQDRGGAEVWMKSALGGSERKLAEVPARRSIIFAMHRLTWSPDGKWLAVGGGSPEPVEGAGLRLLSVSDGTMLTLSTPVSPGGIDVAPAFAPSGRRLAFIRWDGIGRGDAYVLNLGADYAASGAPVRVTSAGGGVYGVAWTPDGERLIYSSRQQGMRNLYAIPVGPDGRASGPSEPLSFGEQALSLSISPRGRTLVYAKANRVSNIWRIALPAGGASPTRVIASTLDDQAPDYAPDGNQIVFASSRSGNVEIWMVGSDGQEPKQLTHMNGPSASMPRWSPTDRRAILFTSRREGMADLYVLDPETARNRRLTFDPGDEINGSWSRDGNFVYYASSKSGRNEIWRMPSSGGPAIQITQDGGDLAQESTDGRALFVAAGTKIRRIPSGGGTAATLLDDLFDPACFTVAEDGLYYLAEGRDTASSLLRFYDLRAAQSRTIRAIDQASWFGVAISPDRHSLLYSVRDSDQSDLMMVEHVR